MHPALDIPEILLDIFHHCCPSDASEEHRLKLIPDLASLARTCRTFKEPALDLLWGVLIDLSPLARCRPETSQKAPGKRNLVKQPNYQMVDCLTSCQSDKQYSFTKQLTSDDWDIILSYTRRTRIIYHFTRGLTRKSIEILSGATGTTNPLFPNLRVLHYLYAQRHMPLLDLPLPSLSSLSIEFNYSHFTGSHGLPVSFPKLCPDIRALCIRVLTQKATVCKLDSSHVCRWQNLQSLECPELSLDVDALVHVSRMPALTTLNLGLSNTSSAPNSTLSFCNVLNLTLNSTTLNPASSLLFQCHLPAITKFTIYIRDGPSKQDLAYFFSCIEASTEAGTIQAFSLTQSIRIPLHHRQRCLVDFNDLRPCLGWSSLRYMKFNIECDIVLTDRDVFTLASAWPRLQNLFINPDWGWGPQPSGSGVTPGGFIRLLQTCRSLSQIAVVLDTRGYTSLPPDHARERAELMVPPAFSVNVIDSSIGAENVTAIASFLSGITAGSELSFFAWSGRGLIRHMDTTEIWQDVYEQVITTAAATTTTIP